jgi:TolB-like protein/DNA-binding winged helix-turn-helix (wHTH) protein/Tfp pilus assembly protein PilF
MAARIFHFDGWMLNLQSGELERGSTRTRLQEHPLQVLASLLENPGGVVTREELIAQLWPDRVVDFDAGLNSAVRKLRVALGDTADTPRYVETLPRRGYRFIGAVEGSGDAQAAALVASDPGDGSRAAEADPRVPRRRFWMVAVPCVLVLAGLLAWLTRGAFVHTPSASSSPGARVAAPAFTPPPHSVAVLPFVNMSGDPSQDYFSDGLSEEMLNTLSQIDELQVAAQTSSFYFKGKGADLDTVARKLNVATVLEGSVRREGHTVRITAQLINAVTGFHLWSRTYDRDLGDMLALQTEIANAVASALKVTLFDANSARTGLGGTRDPLALDAYLRGLKLSGATVRSGEEARQTIAAFSEALRLDPDFALAYTGRARARLEYGSYFLNQATRAAFTDARDDATRAIALAPQLGEAHAALGEVLEIGFFDFAPAADKFARAMALSPGDARVLRAYSHFAATMGHADVAIPAARHGVELDPLNVLAYRVLGDALESARQFPEAAAAFDRAIKLNPTHASEAYQRRGRLYYLMGDVQAAKASCEAEPDTNHVQTCMPLIYEKLGQHAAAEAALVTAIAAQGEGSSFQYAQIYAQWGETQKALDWLETGLRIRDPGMECVKTDAFLDPLRGQPRFQAIERALKFPP